MENWSDKKVLVLGLAKSGLSVAHLLMDLGSEIIINDARPLTNDPDAQDLRKQGITVIGGGHPESLVDESIDYLVKNPGIPYSNPLIQKAQSLNIPVITEIELASQFLKASLIGVTGSNGKTTTSTLIADMLRHDDRPGDIYLVGNIGTPLAEVVKDVKNEDDVVVELSSFQLQGTRNFRPHIAVITNIYSAHLDYHGSQKAYEEAKMKITQNQTPEDYLIYNADQEGLLEKISSHTQAQLIPFSANGAVKKGAYISGGAIYWNEEKVADLDHILLPGHHNLENILAATAGAKLLHCSNEAITQTLASFRGVAHRIQYVTEICGRKFYNDSKATNAEATETALKSFEQPIVLIAGGLDRHLSLDQLAPYLKDKVRAVIGIGESGEKMLQLAKDSQVEKTALAESMEIAIEKAMAFSEVGDIILLSPAHASWDQYTNFEERGQIFMDGVNALKEKCKEGDRC